MRGDFYDFDSLEEHAGFNSHPCMRGDGKGVDYLRWTEGFNSHPCMRGDSMLAPAAFAIGVFQFTPLHEG